MARELPRRSWAVRPDAGQATMVLGSWSGGAGRRQRGRITVAHDGRRAAFTRRLPEPRRIRSGSLARIESMDRFHLVVRKLEVEYPEVLLDPLGRDRLRDNHVAQLDVPAEHDL